MGGDNMAIKKANFKTKKWGRRFISFGLILLGIFLLLDFRIRPIIQNYTAYQSKVVAERILNRAMDDLLETTQPQYQNFINLTYGENGQVSSIQTNTINLNKLKTQVALVMNEAIDTLEVQKLSITSGTASGFHVFYGKGFEIPVRMVPAGYSDTQFISRFTSAGINQTLHQIILKLKIDITIIVPGYNNSVTVETDFIIAETIIIGSVPESYTYINSSDKDLINQISDYGAQAVS